MSHLAILSSSLGKKLIPTLGPKSVDNALTNLHTDNMLFVFVNITCPLKLLLFEVDLQKFMSELLTFLKPHLQPSLQLHNPCEWLSRVFIEQDDDMLEAAKASLSIYLQVTRCVYFKYFGLPTSQRISRHAHQKMCFCLVHYFCFLLG